MQIKITIVVDSPHVVCRRTDKRWGRGDAQMKLTNFMRGATSSRRQDYLRAAHLSPTGLMAGMDEDRENCETTACEASFCRSSLTSPTSRTK